MPQTELICDLRRLEPRRPPAVLLGGLDLTRALGLARVPVIVATADPADPALSSRYVRGVIPLPRGDDYGQKVQTLMAAGEILRQQLGQRIPLFYGSDGPLMMVYDHADELQQCFRFLACPRELGLALLHKDRFVELMLQLGLPVPQTFSWDEVEARRPAGPLLVKPRFKTNWIHSPLYLDLLDKQGKALIFPTAELLLADAGVRPFREQLIVQQYIPGGDDMLLSYHGFADDNGFVMASFCGRKLRTFPRHTGESSYIELIKDPALERFASRAIARMGIRGPFKLDVKRDPRDGRHWLMEINARYTLWNYLGAANGLNLLAVAYGYLLHRSWPQRRGYGTVYRWLDPYIDLNAFREQRDAGQLHWARWLGSLLARPKVQSSFAWTDPVPFVLELRRFMHERMERP